MSTLHITLLGDFSLTYGDQVVTAVNTARLQSLLAYLVLHRTAPQNRRHLAFLFWPDSAEGQARSNLRNLLHLLRHALPQADDFLQIDSMTVQWRPDALFTLDTMAFEEALGAADQAQCVGDDRAQRTALEAAAMHYRGDLLPACYEDWLHPERERLRQLFVTGVEHLINLLAQQKDAPAAIRHAQRLLRMDPLHETTYQQLMRLYAQLGDRAHALNTYYTCVAVLQRELGVKPSAATQTLYHRLQTAANHPVAPTPPAARPSHNLPALLTSFVGRTDALATIQQALEKARLITLTGPGGFGKTRLALAVADAVIPAYPDGVWLVELGALRDAALVAPAVAKVLALAEEPARPLLTTLVDSLRDQHLLLILDTCEHLIESCAELVQTLLHACPKLRILATSRERLAVAGEVVWPVPPLTTPPLAPLATTTANAHAWLQQYDAVHLLVDRIQAVLPTFTVTQQNAPALAQISVHLDGMPLALELAAARASLLSVSEIADHLDQRFQLLRSGTRDAIPRHQTLAAALDWSYDRLPPAEQVLLRRLASFDSTFTLAAAQSICTELTEKTTTVLAPDTVLDLLAHLVDKSLVNVILQPAGTTRYGLLETIRAYGYDRLVAANEVTACRQRQLTFFTQLAEAAEPHLQQHDQVAWLDQLDAEQDNLRGALSWVITTPTTEEQAALGLRLGGALWRFWIYRSHFSEGSTQLAKLLTATAQSTAATGAAYAKVLLGAGCLVGEQGDYAAAQELLERALARYQALALPAGIAEAMYSLAWLANWRGDPVTARRYYEASIVLYQQLNDAAGLAWALRGLAWIDRIAGDLRQAERRIRASLQHFQTTGDLAGLCFALGGLAYIALDREEYTTAQQYAEQSLAYARQVGDQLAVSRDLRLLGRLAAKTAHYAQAIACYRESLTLCCSLNDKYGIAQNYHGLGEAAMALADLDQATEDLQAARHYYQMIDYQPGLAWLLLSTGDLARQQGQHEQAACDYAASRQLGETIQQPWLVTAAQERLASLPTPDFPRNV